MTVLLVPACLPVSLHLAHLVWSPLCLLEELQVLLGVGNCPPELLDF